MSLTKSRANAKATPDAVFAACALLETSNPSYTNEDVISITGGGMSVVAPLVKIYKAHREAIKACSSLNPAITITLVESLSKRIAAIKSHADKAISDLMKASEESINDLSSVNKEQEERLAANDEEISQLNITIEGLREQLASEREHIRLSRLDLANALTAAENADCEITALKTSYDEKLVALADRHSQILADRLEKQRLALDAEKNHSLAAMNAEHDQQLAAAKAALEHERSARLDISDRVTNLEATMNQRDIQHRSTVATLEISKDALESQLADTKAQLKDTRELYQNMVDAMMRENTVTRTAESFNEKMAEVVGKLDSLILTKNSGDK